MLWSGILWLSLLTTTMRLVVRITVLEHPPGTLARHMLRVVNLPAMLLSMRFKGVDLVDIMQSRLGVQQWNRVVVVRE